MDKRPDAEIRIGAALNVAEPLECGIDDMIRKVMEDALFPHDILRELISARHHVFRARLALACIFERLTENSSWLTYMDNLQCGHDEMKSAKQHADSLLADIATANAKMQELGLPWEADSVWATIWEHVGDLSTKIADSDTALTVAALTASERF